MFPWNLLRTRSRTFGVSCLNRANNAGNWRQILHANRGMCTSSNGKVQSTVGDVERRWRRRFEEEGIPEPVESIEHIIAHVIGIKKITDMRNFANNALDAQQLEKVETLCQCRLSRMPVQYIIREWDFRDITLKLEPPVFIPRPETEILVDFLLKRIYSKSGTCNILEIGCGSGAISLSLAHSCSQVNVVAIDTNIHACELTLENAQNLNLENRITVVNATLNENSEIEVSSILNKTRDIDFKKETFDFIVSNPPYIPTEEVFKLEPEVKIYEDIRALDGGHDGLKVIKPLLHYAAKALQVGGHLFMEVDPSHPEYIQFFSSKFNDLKLKYEHTYKDYCNNERIVELSKIK